MFTQSVLETNLANKTLCTQSQTSYANLSVRAPRHRNTEYELLLNLFVVTRTFFLCFCHWSLIMQFNTVPFASFGRKFPVVFIWLGAHLTPTKTSTHSSRGYPEAGWKSLEFHSFFVPSWGYLAFCYRARERVLYLCMREVKSALEYCYSKTETVFSLTCWHVSKVDKRLICKLQFLTHKP